MSVFIELVNLSLLFGRLCSKDGSGANLQIFAVLSD
jgi:hypothetical protein